MVAALSLLLSAIGAGCGGSGGGGGNTAPTASFLSSTHHLVLDVDASTSSDAEDPESVLQVRWDWEDDGVWDTTWSTAKVASHTYAVAGVYTVALQVQDTGGRTGRAEAAVVASVAPWIRRASGEDEEDLEAVDALADGSIVVGGIFVGKVTLGPGELHETTLVADMSAEPYAGDVLLARYDPQGSLVWARRAGGPRSDNASSLTVLQDGSFLVVGSFQEAAVFGEGEANETTLVSAGATDVFVARYAPNGTLTWAKRAGGAEYDYGHGIAAYGDGSFVVTGAFAETAVFGPGDPNETELSVAAGSDYASSDVFVARYQASGALSWARRAGGTSWDSARRLTLLPSGSAVVVGGFAGAATFGAGESHETTLTSAGADDVFVATFGPTGTLGWARRAGGSSSERATDVATSADGAVVLVVGNFEGDATFGPGESGQTVLTTQGMSGIFLARYAASGALVWARKALANAWDGPPALDALPHGGSVVTGNFEGNATFAPGEAGETHLTSVGAEEMFLVRYDETGRLTWARGAGGPGDDGGRGVVVLADGSPAVVGTFSETATFDPGAPGETDLVATGTEEDVFVVKYDPEGRL